MFRGWVWRLVVTVTVRPVRSMTVSVASRVGLSLCQARASHCRREAQRCSTLLRICLGTLASFMPHPFKKSRQTAQSSRTQLWQIMTGGSAPVATRAILRLSRRHIDPRTHQCRPPKYVRVASPARKQARMFLAIATRLWGVRKFGSNDCTTWSRTFPRSESCSGQ